MQAARAEVEALRTTLAAREEDLDLTKKDLAGACASGDEMACRVGEVSDELEAAEAKAKTQREAAAKAKAEAKAAAEAAKSRPSGGGKGGGEGEGAIRGPRVGREGRGSTPWPRQRRRRRAEEAKAPARSNRAASRSCRYSALRGGERGDRPPEGDGKHCEGPEEATA